MANRAVYIEKDDKEHKFKAYEVLNNPNNCQIRWVGSCCGQVPPSSVWGTDEYENNSYVGRTIKRYKGMSQSLLNFIDLCWGKNPKN